MTRIRQRKRVIVASFRNGIQSSLENTPRLQLVFGEAHFTGPKTIELTRKDGSRSELTAEWIFINAGCRPFIPALPGLGDVPFLTSTSIMELDLVPEHLLVLGGGYIGLEFGQLFRRLGSRVTIVQSGQQLINGEDSDVAAEVLNILRQDGVEVLLDARAQSVAQKGSEIQLTISFGGFVENSYWVTSTAGYWARAEH